MNKKLIFVAAMLLPLVITGCKGKAKDRSFEENLSYKTQLTGEEQDKLTKKVIEQLDNVTGMSEYVEARYTSGNFTKVVTDITSAKVTYYSNYYIHGEGESTRITKQNGITLTESQKMKSDTFINEEKKYYFEVNEAEKDGLEYPYLENLADEKDMEEAKKTFYKNDMDIPFGPLCYKDGKGYVYVESFKDETYTPFTWGNDTRVKHVINEQQAILKVNEKYQIKSFTMMRASYNNFDSATGVLYEEPQKVFYMNGEYSVSYGKRKAGNFDKIAATVEGYRLGDYDEWVRVGKVDESGVFTPAKAATLNYSKKIISLQKYHFEMRARFTIQEPNNAIVVENLIETYKNYADDAPVKEEYRPDFSATIENVRGLSINQVAQKQVINAKEGVYDLSIEFDVEVASDGTVTVSNAVISYYFAA